MNRRHSIDILAMAFLAMAAVCTVPAERASAQATTRASVSSAGVEGDFDSGPSAISGNGRFVAYASSATTLVAGDTNNSSDIFVYDRQTNQTVLVSVDSAGVQGNFDSVTPAISADGRFVAFASLANNLFPNDTNDIWDIFVRDMVGGVTTMVSVDATGAQGIIDSTYPSISADGRYVAFQSYNPLVTADTNGSLDIYVYDTQTGQIARASVDSSGIQGNGESINPSVSASGLIVAFASGSSNFDPSGDGNSAFDVFVHDFGTGQTVRASVSTAGFEGNSDSLNPVITPDGSLVSFTSYASQLVPGDTNGTGDVFVRDLLNGTTERVSVGTAGIESNDQTIAGAISSNGRYVAFRSKGSNLVPADTNSVQDAFRYDRTTATTIRVSVDSAGVQGNDVTDSVAISADGRFVAFGSFASNLVPGDTNQYDDVFVRDTAPCADGTVNSGLGLVVNVLDVNSGTRVISIAAHTAITVTLTAAPTGPSPSNYALWVWRGLPTRQSVLTVGTSTLGCTINPTPFNAGQAPQAFKCLRGGLGAEYCTGVTEFGRAPASAPWSLRKGGGLRAGTVLTLQGVIQDNGSANPMGLSVTNAVIVKII